MPADLSKLLIDTMTFKPTVLEESTEGPGRYVARGEFARSDKPTENGRYYPHSLWEREIGRLRNQMKEGRVYGELDHPADGRTQLKRASHIVTDLRLEGPVVVGEAQIMDTDSGRNLKAIMDAGGAVGVSSRGFGTTKPNMKGENIVQDDYKLMTFDFVAEPAMSSAYPKVRKEDVESPGIEENNFADNSETVMEDITLEYIKNNKPDLYESLVSDAEREYEKKAAEIWAKKIEGAKQEKENDLRKEFSDKLEKILADSKKEIEESVKDRLSKDPEVAGAKTALEEVKSVLRPYVLSEDAEQVVREKEAHIEELQNRVADKDLELASLREENKKLADMAKEAGYRYRLENRVSGLDDAEVIKSMVGDVTSYANVNELDEKVDSIIDYMNREKTEQEERDREKARLKEELNSQKEATQKAIQASQQLSVQLYAETRLSNHPDADNVRQIIEDAGPQTKEEVDRIIDRSRPRPKMHEDLDSIRSRVRQKISSGTAESLIENEEQPRAEISEHSEDYNGLGAGLTEIRNLAGLENPNRN